MKLYAPAYYQDFQCIADRCTHSCCIGWEIDVDGDTVKKYDALSCDYADEIRRSIDRGGTPHFRLTADERCPHLDARGLCRIILSCGEDALCDICREHPRFYHDTNQGREVGIGMACEEAARLILSSDAYASFSPIGEVDGEAVPLEFDAVSHRARLYAILSDRSVPYEARLQEIGALWEVSPRDFSDSDWKELLSRLEYLDEGHKDLFSAYSSTVGQAKNAPVLERALAYFIFRHCSDACDADEFRASLGCALFCERLLASLIASNPSVSPTVLARTVSEELEYSEENTDEIRWMF